MKYQRVPWLSSLLVAACAAGAATAQVPFVDNFDSYAVGSVINGNPGPPGGWKQWGNAANSTSVIEDGNTGHARSGNSVSVNAFLAGQTSDLVHEFTGANVPGQYTLRAFTYAETGIADKWFFIALNTYSDSGPVWKWSVQLTLDPATMTCAADCGSTTPFTVPLLLDQWVEVRACIDLTADSVRVFYGGDPVGPAYSWTAGVYGQDVGPNAGALNIAAVDLYHAVATTTPSGKAYWDDFDLTALTPPVVYCTAKVNALGCTPAIQSTGMSSAALKSGFTVSIANVRNNHTGILIYTNTGQAAMPFQGGYLCIPPFIKRSIPLITFGTPPPAHDCSGIYSVDMNWYARQTSIPPPGKPAPYLLVPGTVVDCQAWGHDAGFPFPNNTTLSDALEYTVGI